MLVAILLASALDAALPFVLFAERGHGCSCPIKGPCCKGAVCPMEAARRHTEGLAFRSCGAGASHVAMPNFLRWTLLAPVRVGRAPLTLLADAAQPAAAAPSAGIDRVPEHPPRRPFLAWI